MKQEDKELLLRDLCTRLPYGVKCRYQHIQYVENGKIIDINMFGIVNVDGHIKDICDIKPYLFPLSSMTEEQKNEYNRWKHEVPVCHYEYGDVVEEIELLDSPESFDYLIENHFDYRGLIPMGLALNATGLNIY